MSKDRLEYMLCGSSIKMLKSEFFYDFHTWNTLIGALNKCSLETYVISMLKIQK